MTNAELFKQTFDRYATDVWSLPENEFLEWLNADVQQKTGHWIANKAKYYPGWVHCSECGEDWTHLGRPPYCPACGAKMIEPQESEDNG